MRGPARGLSSSPVVKRNIFLVQGLQGAEMSFWSHVSQEPNDRGAAQKAPVRVRVKR